MSEIFSIKLDYNLSEMLNNINQELEKETALVFDDMVNLAQRVLDDSQLIVPVDTGALKGSGFITSDYKNLYIQVGYGLPLADYNSKTKSFVYDYAVQVHEDLGARHKEGQAKFLEVPARNYFTFAADYLG